MSTETPESTVPGSSPMPVRLRPEIAAMAAYKQGKAPGDDGFKLSSNENPFPPLAAVLAAIDDAARSTNRYPDGAALALRGRLAERFGVGIDHVHLGAGSVALLAQFISAAAGPGDEVLYSWRSFEAYPGLVTVAGASSVQVPNASGGRHDLDAMAEAITDRTRVVILCTPNNPTGAIITAEEFDRFITRVPRDTLVLLDEAYYEFVTDARRVDGSAVLSDHPNLVVLRTFSKAYGLAGLRIGYAVGRPELLAAARSAAIPMSVTDAAQHAALAALDHEEEILERVARIALRRDQLRDVLIAQGWRVPEAQGNFLWLPTGATTVRAAEAFFDAGLAVRAFPADGIRISVGEEESVEKVIAVSQEIVRTLPMGHTTDPLG